MSRIDAQSSDESLAAALVDAFIEGGKAGYLEDTPRFLGYVRHAVSRYDELAPLGRLLDRYTS